MFQFQNIYIYVPIRTKLRLFTKGTVAIAYKIDVIGPTELNVKAVQRCSI